MLRQDIIKMNLKEMWCGNDLSNSRECVAVDVFDHGNEFSCSLREGKFL